MKVILCGLNFIFFVNDLEVFICLEDFSVQYSFLFNREGVLILFFLLFLKFDFYCFFKNGCVVVVDGNNKIIFESNKF